jgi:cytochrome oxidase Cu insertion factor (SCO1/SenC/PrrC family)
VKRSRVGVRGAALAILSAAAIGGAAGVAIHLLQSGGASGSHDNPPGLHGQATWRPGVRRAPDFSLTDQSGRPVSLASFRGGNVMLAFLSSRCRSACAREARYLRTALRLLPSAARPAMIIVSVDPRYDTPESTWAAVERWRLDSATSWHWLLGTRSQLAPVWRSYRVAVRRRGGSTRAGPVYLIDREGFERAGLLYPFRPPGLRATSESSPLADEASDTRRRPQANCHTQDGARVSPTVPGCGGR